jgi:hypothetical protein
MVSPCLMRCIDGIWVQLASFLAVRCPALVVPFYNKGGTRAIDDCVQDSLVFRNGTSTTRSFRV